VPSPPCKGVKFVTQQRSTPSPTGEPSDGSAANAKNALCSERLTSARATHLLLLRLNNPKVAPSKDGPDFCQEQWQHASLHATANHSATPSDNTSSAGKMMPQLFLGIQEGSQRALPQTSLGNPSLFLSFILFIFLARPLWGQFFLLPHCPIFGPG
jgi:hypothetical protein